MSVLENLVRVFAPHTCLGCRIEEDLLLCNGCVQSLVPAASECYQCRIVTQDFAVCHACRDTSPLNRVVAYTYYGGLARELVRRMKYERAQSAAAEVGRLLATQAEYFPHGAVLVHAPTATSRVRARGYDQAALLVREIAKCTDLTHDSLLMRIGQAHQVGAGRAQRKKQLDGVFRPRHIERIKGQHIILVDDVLTTGATLESAARTLRRAGAAQVDAWVFAKA